MEACGLEMGRGLDAAINLRNCGLAAQRALLGVLREGTPVEISLAKGWPASHESMRREAAGYGLRLSGRRQ